MSVRQFTERDLERWVGSGLLTAQQRDAILADLESQRPDDTGLNLTTLLYYGGGLLVLLAYSVFLGFQWEEMNEAGRVVLSGVSFAFFAGASHLLLRSERFRLPGELLQVVAVAVVPLLSFAVLDAIGLWPEEPTWRAPVQAREEYQTDLAWARMGLAGATMLAALAAFRLSRSPYVLVAAIMSFTMLAVDASFQLEPNRHRYEWGTPQLLVIAALGAATLAAGVAARGLTARDYSIWLYVLGLAGLAVGLGGKALESEALGWGVLWMMAALVVLALSVVLQQRLFAAAGLLAIFTYFGKLVFDVFESANAALVLAFLGLLILGAGVLYQRYSEQLFANRGRG